MPKENVEQTEEKKEMHTDTGTTSLMALKNKIQSVVDTMDDDTELTENLKTQELQVENKVSEITFDHTPDTEKLFQTEAVSQQAQDSRPRAIDMFVKTEPTFANFEAQDNDLIESDCKNMGDLIKPTLIKAQNSRKQMERRGRRPRKNSSQTKTQESPVKVKDKHFQYLEKLKARKAQEKLDKENAIQRAKKNKEKLKKKILDRCKELTKTRNIESVNNTKEDFHKTNRSLNKTSSSARQKQFMIRRLKSSQGRDSNLSQTPNLKSSSGQRAGRQGRGRKLAPLDGKPPLGPSAGQGGSKIQNPEDEDGESRRGNRASSMAPRFRKRAGGDGDNTIIGDKKPPSSKSGQRRNMRSFSLARGGQPAKKNKLKSYSFISSVGEWLKKNRLPAKTKVFIISNGYKCIKKALKERGWVQNPNYFSPCFHMKFTLKGSHIGFDGLTSNQIINHFEKVSVLTTKVGLTKTMNGLHLFSNIDQDDFFPRSYDCNEKNEFEAFCMYFKQLEAEAVLKNYLHYALKDARDSDPYILYDKDDSIQVRTALKVCKRRMMNLGELVDSKKDWLEITDKEWEILSRGAKTEEDIKQMMFDKNIKRYEKMAMKEAGKKKKKKRKKKKKKGSRIQSTTTLQSDATESNIADGESSDGEEEESEEEEVQLTPLEQECQYIISKLAKKYPQTSMNGKKNIWIVKPAGLSRGRGIELFSSFHEIYHHLKTRDFSWIIQKYMENPITYNNKKMDIRQWVLVTDWNPLTIWFYTECYIRLSTNDFSLKNIKNRFTHLTNNSVNKRSENFVVEDGFASQGEFSEFLDGEFGEGSWKKIVKQMKKQVKWSLQCAQASVVNRKNSGEIFGYDFCIDQDLKVWLIEVNASPDFGFTSTVTEDLVRRASEDYIKVMIDYGCASKKKKKKVDTGCFKRIYRSRKHEKCKEALGLKFECKGTKMDVDKLKKFYKKEDREYKAKYEKWLAQSDKNFNYDSDQEETVLEDKGDEMSKVDLLTLDNPVIMEVEAQEEVIGKDEDGDSEDSDDESF